jgi:hypothetical protein
MRTCVAAVAPVDTRGASLDFRFDLSEALAGLGFWGLAATAAVRGTGGRQAMRSRSTLSSSRAYILVHCTLSAAGRLRQQASCMPIVVHIALCMHAAQPVQRGPPVARFG